MSQLAAVILGSGSDTCSAAYSDDFRPSAVDMNHWRTQEFCWGGGVQQIQLRTDDRDLGAVAPQSGVLEAAVIWYKKFHFI